MAQTLTLAHSSCKMRVHEVMCDDTSFSQSSKTNVANTCMT